MLWVCFGAAGAGWVGSTGPTAWQNSAAAHCNRSAVVIEASQWRTSGAVLVAVGERVAISADAEGGAGEAGVRAGQAHINSAVGVEAVGAAVVAELAGQLEEGVASGALAQFEAPVHELEVLKVDAAGHQSGGTSAGAKLQLVLSARVEGLDAHQEVVGVEWSSGEW